MGILHGRELRQVPNAEDGMDFGLRSRLSDSNDPEGWS